MYAEDVAPLVPGRAVPPPVWLALLLIGLVAACDLLLWGLQPGFGLVIAALIAAAVTHALTFHTVTLKRALMAWGLLLAAVLPAVDVVQELSVLFVLIGLLAFAAVLIGADRMQMIPAMLRLPPCGLYQDAADTVAMVRQSGSIHLSPWRLLRDWALPVSLGLVFVGLIVLANPVLDQLMNSGLWRWSFQGPDSVRVLLWLFLGLMLWPALRLGQMAEKLLRPTRAMRQVGRGVLINERSVARALILFNVLFAVQTGLDLAYLSGWISLPDGITLSSYTHRGAYPLLAAALLAGGFSILAQPWLGARPIMRILLLIWVSQTVLLVASSVLRLDLYVAAYGLSRLRFAAFIWMALVASGLCLVIWQVLRQLPVGWMIARSAALGLAAIYGCSLINVDGLIARHNLAREHAEMDSYYICALGEGAAPAIAEHERQTRERFCPSDAPTLQTPRDWREWGYRNWRLRRNLALITETTR